MPVTVQQLAHELWNASQTPEWGVEVLRKAFQRQSLAPKILHKLLWAIEATKDERPATLYLAVLDADTEYGISGIADWLLSDVENRIKYFDAIPEDDGKELFFYAFARWKNEVGNRLVDELIRERDRQNAE